MNRPAFPANTLVQTINDLIRVLGGQPADQRGSGASFTGDLLYLCGRADPVNLARLERAFPHEVTAYRVWLQNAPYLTCAELLEVVAARNLNRLSQTGPGGCCPYPDPHAPHPWPSVVDRGRTCPGRPA